MGFEYLTNVPLAQARKEYLERLVSGGFGSKAETIPVFESCGRVTAKAVYAHICAPHYAASAWMVWRFPQKKPSVRRKRPLLL